MLVTWMKSRLSELDQRELCLAAKRACNTLPKDSPAWHTTFIWQGGRYIVRSSLFGVHVYDAQDRKIACMYW
jgi:hypothetical protein